MQKFIDHHRSPIKNQYGWKFPLPLNIQSLTVLDIFALYENEFSLDIQNPKSSIWIVLECEIFINVDMAPRALIATNGENWLHVKQVVGNKNKYVVSEYKPQFFLNLQDKEFINKSIDKYLEFRSIE